MEDMLHGLPKEEEVTLALRRLYAQYGYSRYRMSNFESYDIYHANKSFLKSEGIITFTNAAGKLMALKPDVTMSIVKHAKPGVQSKLYYIENVFRTAHGGSEIREISQMGVESLGSADEYGEAEVVLLAAQSLAAVSEHTVLNLSHMGFVTGLLDACGLMGAARDAALAAVRAKNTQALAALAQEAGCTQAQSLAALGALSGTFPETLGKARVLACTPEMHEAVDALTSLYNAVSAVCKPEEAARLRLDFSVLNDIDYYSGLILQGYVQGVPHAVLAGGRYDHLMRRFEKPQPALGFALYLGELGRAFAQPPLYDVDTLLCYTAQQPAALVAQTVQTLRTQGSVRALCIADGAKGMPCGVRARRTLQLQNDGKTEEVAGC